MSRKAVQAEGIAEAKGIRKMNNTLAGSSREAIVKLRIAWVLQGKRIILSVADLPIQPIGGKPVVGKNITI